MKYAEILKQIQQRKIAPVYYLHGEEGYFIDKIAEALLAEEVVLNSTEASFNRDVFYGPETTANQILNSARCFPVMAERRLVVLREAHRLNKKELDKLDKYFAQPVPSTVLVMLFKDPKVGFPKKVADQIGKVGVDFLSPKLYEKDVQAWISHLIQDQGYTAPGELPAFLTDNLGTQLPFIENELEKIFITLKAAGKTAISMDLVYEFVQVDKEFNSFELVHAISLRDVFRAHLITDRLARNQKLNPAVLTVSSLFRFFHHVGLVHRFQLRDANAIKQQLGVNWFQAKDFAEAARRFPPHLVFRNLGYIQHADLQLKGIESTAMGESHILKTLVWQILN